MMKWERTCAALCQYGRVFCVSVLSLAGILLSCSEGGREPFVQTSTGGSMVTSGGQSGASTGGRAGGSGGETTEVGATCTSRSGETGKVVESRGRCGLDDAFCEPIGDGHYCTGWMPFICPPGQKRIDWVTCGTPPAGGGQGGVGSE